jgi:hypothetical protein
MPPPALRNTWEDCRQAVFARLVALGLPGLSWLPGALLETYLRLWDEPLVNVNYPCQVVSLHDGEEDPRHEAVTVGGPAGLVRVGYPVRVELFNHDPGKNDLLVPWYTAWRAQIAAAFRWQALPVVGCWQVQIRVLPAFDRSLPKYQYFVSGLLLRCLCDEPVAGIPA